MRDGLGQLSNFSERMSQVANTAFDGALLIPGVQRIFRSLWAIAARTWITDCLRWLRQLVDAPIRLKGGTHQTSK